MLGLDELDATKILDRALDGILDVLWVFGHDLVQLFGEEKVQKAAETLSILVFSGTNENPTADFADWVLPTAAYVEKDGTFVNCHGRLQRIGRAFAPLEGSREDWRILLELAQLLQLPCDWKQPDEIFLALAEAVAPLEGLSYETIGTQGVDVATARPTEEVAAP